MRVTPQSNPLMPRPALDEVAKYLTPYRTQLRTIAQDGLYGPIESFLVTPADTADIEQVLAVVSTKVTPALKYVFLVGIGGSNLGAKAVYDALHGYGDLLDLTRMPRLICLDTCNPALVMMVQEVMTQKVLNLQEVLVIVGSKSGGTLETTLNANAALRALKTHGEGWQSRVIVISQEDSLLTQAAQKQGIVTISVASIVGGRYSIFTAMGLVPLAACGIDIKALCAGALKARELCLADDSIKNPALVMASVIMHQYHQGRRILDFFLFNAELESLGKWHRQLIGESLGKPLKEPETPDEVIALTPTVSIGSTDLHSMGQLYLTGLKDRMTLFIMVPAVEEGDVDHGDFVAEPLLTGKGAEELMTAIYHGTQEAYKAQGLPFLSLTMDDISPASLGEAMMGSMIATAFLGELFGVNAFDQPAVELYKKTTRKILSGEK